MAKPKLEDFKDPDDYDKAIEHYYCELEKELADCRNELCLKCGKYQNEHLGACDNCRWHEKISYNNNSQRGWKETMEGTK